jgi:hypothetical protein
MGAIQDGLRALAEGRAVEGLRLSWGLHTLGIRGLAAWIDVASDGSVRERRMQTGSPPVAHDIGRVAPADLAQLARALLQHRFEALVPLAPPTQPGGQKITIDAALGSERVHVELPGTESTRPELREIGAAFTMLRARAPAAPGTAPGIAPSTPAAAAPAGGPPPPPAAPPAAATPAAAPPTAPPASAPSPAAAIKQASPNAQLILASCAVLLLLSCCLSTPALIGRLRSGRAPTWPAGGAPTGGAPTTGGGAAEETLGIPELQIMEGGRWAGKITEGGVVFREGLNVGTIQPDGQILMGTYVGAVDEDGTIRKGGLAYGEITEDGRLKVNGLEKGWIALDSGHIFIGTQWGEVGGWKNTPGCRRVVAAYLFFFAGAL